MFGRGVSLGDKQDGEHPDDEALLALLDQGAATASGPAASEATRRHVADCPVCTRRLEELRALRQVVQEVATHEVAPARDLVGGALERLRLRHASVSRLNELMDVLGGLVRGLVTLLVAPRPPRPPTRDGPAAPDTTGGSRG